MSQHQDHNVEPFRLHDPETSVSRRIGQAQPLEPIKLTRGDANLVASAFGIDIDSLTRTGEAMLTVGVKLILTLGKRARFSIQFTANPDRGTLDYLTRKLPNRIAIMMPDASKYEADRASGDAFDIALSHYTQRRLGMG